jgi:hypothetical protein
MSALFAGDSQLKYLHNVLRGFHHGRTIPVRILCGADIWALLSGIAAKFGIIVLHVGTNNVPHENPSVILHRCKYLLKSIWNINPTAKIVLSAILPRGLNIFARARNNVGFTDMCNRISR